MSNYYVRLFGDNAPTVAMQKSSSTASTSTPTGPYSIFLMHNESDSAPLDDADLIESGRKRNGMLANSITAGDTTGTMAISQEDTKDDHYEDEPPTDDDDLIMRQTTMGPVKSWLLRNRVLEFVVALVTYGIAFVFDRIPVHQRAIPSIQVRWNVHDVVYSRDPSLDYKKKQEQVPMVVLIAIGIVVPIVTQLVFNQFLPRCFKQIQHIRHDTRDFLLSLLISMGLGTMVTQFLKTFAGRLRPCFYDMCQWDFEAVWDGTSNLCSSAKWEKEGRKSFPSGHSSFAFSTLFFLTVYLLGRSRLVSETRHRSFAFGFTNMLKLYGCLLPTFLASWVSVTRAMDNWHNFSDILAGSVIGMITALLGYFYNYGSIFHRKKAGLPLQQYYTVYKAGTVSSNPRYCC